MFFRHTWGSATSFLFRIKFQQNNYRREKMLQSHRCPTHPFTISSVILLSCCQNIFVQIAEYSSTLWYLRYIITKISKYVCLSCKYIFYKLQAHLRPAQPPVLLLHPCCQLGSSLHLHPLQSLQFGEEKSQICVKIISAKINWCWTIKYFWIFFFENCKAGSFAQIFCKSFTNWKRTLL